MIYIDFAVGPSDPNCENGRLHFMCHDADRPIWPGRPNTVRGRHIEASKKIDRPDQFRPLSWSRGRQAGHWPKQLFPWPCEQPFLRGCDQCHGRLKARSRPSKASYRLADLEYWKGYHHGSSWSNRSREGYARIRRLPELASTSLSVGDSGLYRKLHAVHIRFVPSSSTLKPRRNYFKGLHIPMPLVNAYASGAVEAVGGVLLR